MADDTKFSELMTETVGGRERSTKTDSLVEQLSTGGGITFTGDEYTASKQRGKRGNKGNKTAQGTGLATGGAQRDRHSCFGSNCEQKGTNLVSIPHDKGTHFAPMCYDCKETAIKNAKKRGLPVPTSTPMTSARADMFDVQDRDSEDTVPVSVVKAIPMREKPKKSSKTKTFRGMKVVQNTKSAGTGKPGISSLNALVEFTDPVGAAGSWGAITHRIRQNPGDDIVDATSRDAAGEVSPNPFDTSTFGGYKDRHVFELNSRRSKADGDSILNASLAKVRSSGVAEDPLDTLNSVTESDVKRAIKSGRSLKELNVGLGK